MFEVEEKLLVKNKRNAASLFHVRFLGGPVVDKVRGYSNSQPASELLAVKTGQAVAAAVSAYYYVEGLGCQRVVLGQDFDVPAWIAQVGFD